MQAGSEIEVSVKMPDLRKHKSITIDPVRIRGIEAHEFVEEDMGHWGQAHRGARMSGVRFEGRIDLQKQSTVSMKLQWFLASLQRPAAPMWVFPRRNHG